MKSLVANGNGFTVYDSCGRVVYRIDNYSNKSCRQVYLMDLHGNVLFSMFQKVFGFGQWNGYKKDDRVKNEKPLFEVKNCSKFLKRRETEIHVTMGSDSCSFYKIKGTEGKCDFNITDQQGRVVAEAKQKQSSSGVMLGQDVLSLKLEAHVHDHSFIMALVAVPPSKRSPDKVPPSKPSPDQVPPVHENAVAEDHAEKKSTDESNDRVAALTRVETEKRLALIKAWEESEKTKAENKAYKKLSAIGAQENTQRANVQAQLKQIEEEVEKEKAEKVEKMKNKIAILHQIAEEKRAAVEAKRGEEILKVEEEGAKYRKSGTTPTRYLGCFGC
ncbi:hypothetical protein ACET3Z_008503 [Daucus carota]